MKSGAFCTYISKFVEGKKLEGYVKCIEPCDDGRKLIILEEKIAANSVEKRIWEYTLSPPLSYDKLEKLDGFYEATATVSRSPSTDYLGALVHISLRMFNGVILYESFIGGIDWLFLLFDFAASCCLQADCYVYAKQSFAPQ